MTASALRHTQSSHPRPDPAPCLRPVPAQRRRRLPSARTVALYALGLVAGFLLAALASAPAGGEVVAFQVQMAGIAGAVGALAALRARAIARRPARPRAL
jgi:predicted membrane-bound spermidine synthase